MGNKCTRAVLLGLVMFHAIRLELDQHAGASFHRRRGILHTSHRPSVAYASCTQPVFKSIEHCRQLWSAADGVGGVAMGLDYDAELICSAGLVPQCWGYVCIRRAWMILMFEAGLTHGTHGSQQPHQSTDGAQESARTRTFT